MVVVVVVVAEYRVSPGHGLLRLPPFRLPSPFALKG
jgi:hypothetical protein